MRGLEIKVSDTLSPGIYPKECRAFGRDGMFLFLLSYMNLQTPHPSEANWVKLEREVVIGPSR